jgi:hypothetical protein
MKCDSRASFLACTLASLCLGHEPKARVATHNLQKNKMKISDYSTNVKNLADVIASIEAPIDDEDIVAITLNGFGKDYS